LILIYHIIQFVGYRILFFVSFVQHNHLDKNEKEKNHLFTVVFPIGGYNIQSGISFNFNYLYIQ